MNTNDTYILRHGALLKANGLLEVEGEEHRAVLVVPKHRQHIARLMRFSTDQEYPYQKLVKAVKAEQQRLALAGRVADLLWPHPCKPLLTWNKDSG